MMAHIAGTAAEPLSRIVEVDDPSRSIAVVLHGTDGRSATALVTPQRALALAVELVQAAHRRLG